MKILHVSTGDANGGAARAAYRIHRALVDNGIESVMRVLNSGTGDSTVSTGKPRELIKRIGDKVYKRLLEQSQRGWHTDNPILHTFGQISANLVDELNNSDADILHLHWVSGMLSVADIGRLRKPIVWTLHDMWAFCGGEHYAPDDEQSRFRVGYHPNNRPPGERGPDLNRKTWLSKQRAWARQSFTIISPSQWLSNCVQDSVLLRKHPVHVVANPLDTNFPWRPVPQEIARAALGLPQGSRLILTGAIGGMLDPRKGGDLMLAAVDRVIQHVPQGDVRLVIYGQHSNTNTLSWPCPVHWLGELRDDRVLALIYAASDVMVVPSRQEAFGQTASEAQACGTPVVAFDLGGLPDIVQHKKTGWLAPAFDIDSLGSGIEWILNDMNRLRVLRQTAREMALARFSQNIICTKHLAIYNKVIANQR